MKIAVNHALEFYSLTNEIMALTGQGRSGE